MAKQLTGKVALVTGGSRGIGAAIAKRLAADPAQPPRADKLIAEWSEALSKLGFPGAVEVWTKDASETPYADQARAKIVATLRAMQPAAVEAAAPK